jgi:hypothetical protein
MCLLIPDVRLPPRVNYGDNNVPDEHMETMVYVFIDLKMSYH